MDHSSINSINLNVDTTWVHGKASVAVLGRNYESEIVGLQYNNFECGFALWLSNY